MAARLRSMISVSLGVTSLALLAACVGNQAPSRKDGVSPPVPAAANTNDAKSALPKEAVDKLIIDNVLSVHKVTNSFLISSRKLVGATLSGPVLDKDFLFGTVYDKYCAHFTVEGFYYGHGSQNFDFEVLLRQEDGRKGLLKEVSSSCPAGRPFPELEEAFSKLASQSG